MFDFGICYFLAKGDHIYIWECFSFRNGRVEPLNAIKWRYIDFVKQAKTQFQK